MYGKAYEVKLAYLDALYSFHVLGFERSDTNILERSKSVSKDEDGITDAKEVPEQIHNSCIQSYTGSKPVSELLEDLLGFAFEQVLGLSSGMMPCFSKCVHTTEKRVEVKSLKIRIVL